MRIRCSVGQEELEAQALPRRLPLGIRRVPPCVKIKVLPLADGEINLDGIDGGNGGHRPAARIDQSTHLKLRLSGNAVDWRNQPSEIEVDPGRFNGCLGRLNLSVCRGNVSFRRDVILDGVVEVLLAGSLLPRQRRVAVYVKFGLALHCLGVGELGRRLGQLSLGLVESRLKGPWVDLEEQLALLTNAPSR